MGFWWPQLYFETRISFHSFRPETWKHECLYLFQTLKYSLYSEPQITVNQISNIYTFFGGIFNLLKIYFRNQRKWTHRVLDYSCNIPFAVRICLYNHIDFSGISSDLQWCSCLQLATDCTEWVCCIVSYVCKATTQELVQENILPLISSHLGGAS